MCSLKPRHRPCCLSQRRGCRSYMSSSSRYLFQRWYVSSSFTASPAGVTGSGMQFSGSCRRCNPIGGGAAQAGSAGVCALGAAAPSTPLHLGPATAAANLPSLPLTLLLFLQAALQQRLLFLPQLLHRLAPLQLLRCRWRAVEQALARGVQICVAAASYCSRIGSSGVSGACVGVCKRHLQAGRAKGRRRDIGAVAALTGGERPCGGAPPLTFGLAFAAGFGLQFKAWNLRRDGQEGQPVQPEPEDADVGVWRRPPAPARRLHSPRRPPLPESRLRECAETSATRRGGGAPRQGGLPQRRR